MTVVFHKPDGARSSWWEARRATGGRMTGGHMPIGRGVIPHDLGHMATEAVLGLEFGFWGLLARGATFRRGTDRRRTRPGRAIIAEHRDELERAEALGNDHHVRWRDGEPTPVGPTFDALATAWTTLPEGGTLTVQWPSLTLIAGRASGVGNGGGRGGRTRSF